MSRIIILSVAMLLTLTTGCQKKTTQPPAPAAGKVPEDNRHYERLIAGKEDEGDRAAEARAWLDPKNAKNVLWKSTRAQTLQYVDDLYEAGAVKVYAIYAPKDGSIPVNICAELLIVLPSDANVRKKVFRTYNRIDKEIWGPDHEPVKDDGRKYLDLNMDS